MTRPSPSPQDRRAGFTLVELLIVIVIIGILMALLIPAIAGAIRTANDARVVAEITNIATALEQFKSKYGDYPPSRVILSESGSYSTTSAAQIDSNVNTDITMGQLAQRSVQYLRKFFPKAVPATTTRWHDFNGNGTLDSSALYLEGHECLVFFLGGIPNQTSASNIGVTGFGRSPLFPFTNQNPSSGVMFSDARTAPFYEFRADRLIDSDGDGIPGYVDTLNTAGSSQYFAYFSAYGNNMYDPNDVNLDNTWSGTYNVKNGAYDFANSTATNTVVSPSPNPYTSDVPSTGSQFPSFINPTSFQIISAGADAVFGPGGQYSANGATQTLPLNGLSADARLYEQDNLTNFARGRLE